MRILFLSQRIPYPPTRGDKITTFHEVRHLAKRHEISVACLADGDEDLINAGPLREMVASVDAVPLSRSRARLRALAAVPTGRPLTVAYFDEPALHRRVDELVRTQRFDLIFIYSSSMAQFAERHAIPRIMQFADLDSQKWQLYADESRGPMRWVYRLEAQRLLAYERHIAGVVNHSLLCTPKEIADFERLVPGAPISCMANGVDFEFFRPGDWGARVPNNVVFVGVMDYRPNVDAAQWFSREVLPLIRRDVPSASFTICGARPNSDVMALSAVPGVSVTGAVPDVRPHVAAADVAVIPLRMARGIQNKLLEALAMERPVVTTGAAFKGVEGSTGHEMFVADDPEGFAAAVVRLLKDPALRERMGRAGRVLVERQYRWDHQLARLDDLVERLGREGRGPSREEPPAEHAHGAHRA